MSSLRNAIPRRAHKERAQPDSRKKFGLLEKHKDYVKRARAYHQKEQTLQKLKEKAAFRNPDEFYFKMINTKTIDGVHMPKGQANKYTKEELMLMKTQDMGYILQKLQAESKFVNGTIWVLVNTGTKPKFEQFGEAKVMTNELLDYLIGLGKSLIRKIDASYKELEDRKNRAKELGNIYTNMASQKELQKKGKKRKASGR
ncbi:probable U3 small nucleolar RNA-associated 11 [Olea europaea subsp. europaea]|uniref:Probable U3 small nucleolar RNA-associated 11 n=1 Tax=Olea europaea subsp. europaea TaxID=158383 RepID=A0A8S0QX99_OLEEU|nr:probable U3 small nucleolar RNA-associated 11 [Olea europaea subsp. europaea]